MIPAAYHEILKRHPRHHQPLRLWLHGTVDVVLWSVMFAIRSYSHHFMASAAIGIVFAAFCFRSFGLMHDCVHSAGSMNIRVNALVGFWWGVFSFLPFRGWREMHLDHHRWTGNVEKDPTAKILMRFEANGFRSATLMRVAWRSWLPLFGFMQHVVFWTATISKGEYLFVGALIGYLTLTGFALGPTALGLGFFSYLVLVEMINLPHHLGMRQYRGEERFAYHEQNQFTRSCTYPKWFAHGVLLNFNLHTAHHFYPSHPWYQLDALHDEIVEAGLQLNMCKMNEWTNEHRHMAMEDVLAMTFGEDAVKAPEKAA